MGNNDCPADLPDFSATCPSPLCRIACKGFSTDGELKHTIPRGGNDDWLQYNDTVCTGTYVRLDTDIIDIDKLTVYDGHWGKWADTVQSPHHGSYACGARMSVHPMQIKDGFSDNMAWSGELLGASCMHGTTVNPDAAITYCFIPLYTTNWLPWMRYALLYLLIRMRIMWGHASISQGRRSSLHQFLSERHQLTQTRISAIHRHHAAFTDSVALQGSNWCTAASTTGSTKRPSKCNRGTLTAAGSTKRPRKCSSRATRRAPGSRS